MALGDFTFKSKAFLFPDKGTSNSPLILNQSSQSYGRLEVTATLFCNSAISPTLESGLAL